MVRFAVLEIVDDELDQRAPELAEDLEHRVDYPEQYDGEAIARIPDGWVIDWRDVARLMLEDLEREGPPLVNDSRNLTVTCSVFRGGRGLRRRAGFSSPARVSASCSNRASPPASAHLGRRR